MADGHTVVGGGRDIVQPMNERVKKLSQQIRKLSPDEQADLLDELLVHVHSNSDPAILKAWAEEAERRLDRYLSGRTKTRDARKVLAKYTKR
jgi:putative addiction module component